jgi:CHAT domain-containing protein/Tfp pilus assembly protein PilF
MRGLAVFIAVGCIRAWAGQTSQDGPAPHDPAVTEAVTAGEALQKKGDYPGAMERFRWCTAYSREKASERGLAVCLQMQGGVDRLQGNYAEAEAEYREALAHAETARDAARQAYILNNLGNLFGAQGRYSETIALLQRALDINEREGIKDDAAPYQNLAIAYALQGDNARALEKFLSALKIYERLKAINKIALAHYNIGELQIKQGNYAAAKRELLEAWRLGEEAGDRYVTTQAMGDMGHVQEKEGQTAAARESFQKELDLCLQSGFKSCIGESYLNLGNLAAAHGELGSAAASFTSARAVFEGLKDSYNLGQTLRGLANVARLRRNYPEAAQYAESATDLSRGLGDSDGEWQSRALRGLIASDSGDVALARTAYREAIGIIEKMRGKVGGGETEQQRFFEKALYPYRQLALLEAAEGRPGEALRAAESARARVLLDMIAANPERVALAMTEEEKAEEKRLLATLAGLNVRLARATGSAKDQVKIQQDRAWNSYEAFRAALYVHHPGLQAARGESPVLEESEIYALLPNARSAIVEFVCSDDRTLLLVATRGKGQALRVDAFPIGISRAALAGRVEGFRSALEQRAPGFRGEAGSLFRLLLGPAAAALAGKTQIRVIADGALQELPFQTLIDGSGKYWVETVTLSRAPSLTFLRDRSRQQRNGPATLDLVAFSYPVLSGQVARIAELYPRGRTAVRSGAAANETAFRELAPSARVIHLATHGIAEPDNPMRSRVLLAPSEGSSGASRDGWLETWEFMSLKLHADVVILSACETGRGHAEGEGLVGLSWALFAAGARHTVVSQWKVESASTTELMTGLHQGLRKGLEPAAALRLSMLAVMKDPRYRHPFYWGAFTVAGSGAEQ